MVAEREVKKVTVIELVHEGCGTGCGTFYTPYVNKFIIVVISIS